MASIRIPTPLRAYTGGSDTINVGGDTVGQALDDLVRQHPDLKQHLFKDSALRSFVNIYVGEDDIRYLDGVDTPITPETRLLLVPSVAGGSQGTRHQPI
jgi:molybdopterin converting factor small subunit